MAQRHDICEELGFYGGAKWRTAKGSRLICLGKAMKLMDGAFMVVKIEFFNVTNDCEMTLEADRAVRLVEVKEIKKDW